MHYHENHAAAEKVVADIEELNGRAFTVQADLSHPDEVEKIFQRIDGAGGKLVVLVNNAGDSGERAAGLDIDCARLERSLALHLISPFLCIKAAAKRMRTHGDPSAIVNVSSHSVVHGGGGYHVDYAAAKAGLESLTRGFAREWRNTNIRINVVSPGSTDTDMWMGIDEDARRKIVKNIPLGRFGTADEVAAAIIWLLSPQARGVDGALLRVDGGRQGSATP